MNQSTIINGKSQKDVPVTEESAVVFETDNVSDHFGIVLWVENTGLQDVAAASSEVSPDGKTWFANEATALIVAAGAKKFLKVEGFPFVRVLMNCGAGESTTVDIGFTAQGVY